MGWISPTRSAGCLGFVALALLACSQPDAAPLRGFRLIGHRAASGLGPENTLPALERAREAGLHEVEIDVQLSRDGGLILFHDPKLGGKTDLKGAVAKHDRADLERAEIGRWWDEKHPNAKHRYTGTRLASLDAALAQYAGRFIWHLEMKSAEEALPEVLYAAIRRAGVEDRVRVSSFRPDQLLGFRALAPEVPLCLLVYRTGVPGRSERLLTPEEAIAVAAEHRFDAVSIAAKDLRPELVREAHAHGIEVFAFRIKRDKLLLRVVALGVDAALVPHPDRARRLLDLR